MILLVILNNVFLTMRGNKRKGGIKITHEYDSLKKLKQKYGLFI